MSGILSRLQRVVVTSAILIGISACGGDSGGSDGNILVTNDDVGTSTNGNTIVINVLDNDIYNDENSLTISTISSNPENGTAVIADNGSTIEYTPNAGYLGLDGLAYTISDGSLEGEASVVLTVNQRITLSGNVTDSLAGGSQVIVTVGNDTFEATTNDEGAYTVEVSTLSLDEMVSLRAYGSVTNNQEFIELVSIAEDFSGLVAADDGDNILTASELHALNITQLSTALFLMAKDLNTDQSFADFSNYEAMVEQVDIDGVLQATGMIKLLIEDVNYTDLLTENVLTLLDDAGGEFTVLAIEGLAQKAEVAGIDDAMFSAHIEAAINQSLATPNMTPPFTPELLANKRIVQTESVRVGWMARSGRVMDFADDGTFTLYTHNIQLDYGVAGTATGTWSVNGSRVDMLYSDVLEEEFFYGYARIDDFYEKYGEDVALAFSIATGPLVDYETRLSETERTLHLIVQTKDTIKVRIDTSVTDTIILPQAVVDTLNDGRTEASYIIENSKAYNLTADLSSQLEALTGVDMRGDWVLFMPKSLAPASFNDPTDETTDFVPLFYGFDERVHLYGDGTVSTLFSDAVFNWSFYGGKIILANESERLEYLPYYQLNNELLVVVEHYQNDQLIDVFVEQITQLDDTYSVFTDNLVTELPVIYNANLGNYQNSKWAGDVFKPEFILGYQFNDDGSMSRLIRTEEDVSVDGEENVFFSGDTSNWNWSRNGRQMTLKHIATTDVGIEFYERYFEVLSVDSLGRVLIYEYSVIENFIGRRTNLPPRLNLLTLENLEQWPEAWEDNDLQ